MARLPYEFSTSLFSSLFALSTIQIYFLRSRHTRQHCLFFRNKPALCDSTPPSQISSGNNNKTNYPLIPDDEEKNSQNGSLNLNKQLNEFLLKYLIPKSAWPKWNKTNDQDIIEFELPVGISVSQLASTLAEFRSSRLNHMWKEDTNKMKQFYSTSIRTHRFKDSIKTCLIINPLENGSTIGSSHSPTIIEFHCKQVSPNRHYPEQTKFPNDIVSPIHVTLYKEKGHLTQDDLNTIQLALYLSYVKPSHLKSSNQSTQKTHIFRHTPSFFASSFGNIHHFLEPENHFFPIESNISSTFHPFQTNDVFPENEVYLTRNHLDDPFLRMVDSMFSGGQFPSTMFNRTTIHPSFENGSPYNSEDNENHLFAELLSHGRSHTPHQNQELCQTNRHHAETQIQKQLESMGAMVYIPNNTKDTLDWGDLAGYEESKKTIEEALLLGLSHPEIFSQVTTATRGKSGESSRPRMILFNGPPGTGKTSTARIIANTVNLPLVYVSLESIVSKWFGDSEKNLGKIFDLAKALGKMYQGCVIFVDEIDSLASSRDEQGIHEASRRMLSILLQRLDGFNTQHDKTIFICATNREKSLDEAFRNRVDVTVMFPLPNYDTRCSIIRRYAKHLKSEDVEQIASNSTGLSGRNIKDFCAVAERRWVGELLRRQKNTPNMNLEHIEGPPSDYYVTAALEKQKQQS